MSCHVDTHTKCHAHSAVRLATFILPCNLEYGDTKSGPLEDWLMKKYFLYAKVSDHEHSKVLKSSHFQLLPNKVKICF